MSEFIKIIKKCIPQKLKKEIKKAYEITPMYHCKVKNGVYVKKSFGKTDPDKTYMVMTRSCKEAGIYSDYTLFLMGLVYAHEKGYIPVIDRLTNPAIDYQDPKTFGKINGWELYFEQPAGITVQEVFMDKKNVLIYDVQNSYNQKRFQLERAFFLKETDKWLEPYKEIAKTQLKNNVKVQECINREYDRILAGKNNVIGVAIREGFNKEFYYNPDRASDHPIQPEITEVIKIVGELQSGENYIFLTCQTEDTIIAFKEEYGDRVLYTDRKRESRESLRGEIIDNSYFDEGVVDRQTRNVDYIVEMNLLAKCDYLVCGITSGTNAVKIMKSGLYKQICVIDKGLHKAGKKDVHSW